MLANKGRLNSSQWHWFRTRPLKTLTRLVLTFVVIVMPDSFWSNHLPQVAASMREGGYPILSRILFVVIFMQIIP